MPCSCWLRRSACPGVKPWLFRPPCSCWLTRADRPHVAGSSSVMLRWRVGRRCGERRPWEEPSSPASSGRLEKPPVIRPRSTVVEGERPINYRGTYVGAKRDVPSSSARDVGVECALVFDPATGEFTVEKIGGAVKSLRVSRDARGDDAGVGVGVNEDANKTAEKAKKKPRKQDPKEAAAMEQAAAAVAKATEARRAEAKATETAVGPFARFVSESEGSDPESE